MIEIEKKYIKCGLCGFEFNENEAQTACEHCSMKKTCKLIKCPKCGYEMPLEPRWLNSLLKRRKQK